MPPDPLFWKAERLSNFAHLVFEKHAQWFNEFEGHICWQAANVMVRLDAGRGGGGIMAGAFDDIGIESTLGQKGDGALLLLQV